MYSTNDYLKALEFIHKNHKVHVSKITKFVVIGSLFLLIMLPFLGVEKVIALGVVTIFLVYTFSNHIGLNNWIKTRISLEQKQLLLKKKIFRNLTNEIAPWINMSFSSPYIKEELISSSLLKNSIEFIHSSGSLSGLKNSSTAFCASYIQAGYYSKHKDSNQRITKIENIHFKGFVFLMDFADLKSGWVNLTTDYLDALNWLADEWRQARDSNYIQLDDIEFEKIFHARASSSTDGFRLLSSKFMEKLVEFKKNQPTTSLVLSFKDSKLLALMPESKDPFQLSSDSSFWSKDIKFYQQTVSLFADLVDAIDTSPKILESKAS